MNLENRKIQRKFLGKMEDYSSTLEKKVMEKALKLYKKGWNYMNIGSQSFQIGEITLKEMREQLPVVVDNLEEIINSKQFNDTLLNQAKEFINNDKGNTNTEEGLS